MLFMMRKRPIWQSQIGRLVFIVSMNNLFKITAREQP